MPSFGMLRRVALVRTDVPEEISASIIKLTRIDEIRITLAVTKHASVASCHPDDGGDTFFRNFGSYKSHMA
jgi:hypothetical protein